MKPRQVRGGSRCADHHDLVRLQPEFKERGLQRGQQRKNRRSRDTNPVDLVLRCPGCGDFSVLAALQTALFELGLEAAPGRGGQRHRLLLEPAGLHQHLRHAHAATAARWRSPPGVKLGNHELKVIATGGDGDGFGIGAIISCHTMRATWI